MRPEISLFDEESIDSILLEAKSILANIGIFVENTEGIELFRSNGLLPDDKGWIQIPEKVVDNAISSIPSTLKLYDRDGMEVVDLIRDLCFDPGSTALTILDGEDLRDPVTDDYIEYVKVVDQLENIHAQSTAMICKDVDVDRSDAYRLLLSLLYSKKPVITGTFRKESFDIMKQLLVMVRGSEEALREKPLAIFDACVTSPLRWSDLTTQSVIDCAKAGIPSNIISMPMMGANSPASIYSTIVQHTAEVLSGVVIAQLVKKGAPVIWGGSATVFDLRKGSTPIGAVESMMITAGYAQVAKSLDFPVHGYIGLSDTKINDMQAGFETGYGMALATLAEINLVSGAGMINFESTFSIEKLIIDDQIVGMNYRLHRGIEYIGLDTEKVLREYEDKQQLLTHKTTLKNYRREFHFPSALVDRGDEWKGKSIHVRAKEEKIKLLESYKNALDPELAAKLQLIFDTQ
ncbi:MAG: trimethylamine methyltransferase family protein [Candidatus Heimdallarchaeota archaeon]|nr:trimethylamine methyltransferase family protein [Candidatus Heimdallarchaeota archaeon]